MKAVILAAGTGSRLKPLTQALPKPMLPIGSKPLLEININYLKNYGFDEVIITINYLKDSIMHYFDDGRKFGLRVTYSVESTPLGTAGGVKKVAKSLTDTFVAILADILADIDYNALIKRHKEQEATGTMVVFEKSLEIPYGVLNLDVEKGNIIVNLEEKPQLVFPVYAGIVVLEPTALDYMKDNEFLHMTDLFLRLKENGEKIIAYHHRGNWIDIGQDIEQYLRVNQEIMSGNTEFNPDLSQIIFGNASEAVE